ncbi:hypothetical protein N7492_003261 [Penicillium capsulatum]|uniref:Uncharacterized protein n=1 Tax=Penicillium capsulatum TaxID=69766 RepID=A0A9W9IMT0_9EURO|nr:hypothetical protein N7492_003261 [Penicillium capsulatum]KAJ6122153.1 hypothetical protein N7512_004618 [Penicillium capsulatum]
MQHQGQELDRWNHSLRRLASDVGAATISASLVAPAVAIIDRAIVEKSSLNQSLLRGLRNHALNAVRSPRNFVFRLPFGLIWSLYAVTFMVANGTDSICDEMKYSAKGMATFVATTLVNVPMAVWKDIRFAQIYGTDQGNVKMQPPLQNRGVARAATAIFLLRDCVTIFGSFTLAPKLSEVIPDRVATHPHAKPIITQLTMPVLTQLVATPMHLLALDLYMRQQSVPLVDRIVQSQRYLPSTTVVRCIRIVPAFGFGCLANVELRSWLQARMNIK